MGMVCPKCGSDQLTVVDTRRKEGTVWRRRGCISCGNRFNTVEIGEERMKSLKKAEKQRRSDI